MFKTAVTLKVTYIHSRLRKSVYDIFAVVAGSNPAPIILSNILLVFVSKQAFITNMLDV